MECTHKRGLARAALPTGEIGSYPCVSVATMSRFKTDSSSHLTDLTEKVAEILCILQDRERRVLELRYGLSSGKALTLNTPVRLQFDSN